MLIELNPDELLSIAGRIEKVLEQYKDKVEELSQLKNVIDGSSDWIESSLKPSFINSLDSYIATFMSLEEAISNYIEYIKIKANDFNDLESMFS